VESETAVVIGNACVIDATRIPGIGWLVFCCDHGMVGDGRADDWREPSYRHLADQDIPDDP
jgi:hypothetical protein